MPPPPESKSLAPAWAVKSSGIICLAGAFRCGHTNMLLQCQCLQPVYRRGELPDGTAERYDLSTRSFHAMQVMPHFSDGPSNCKALKLSRGQNSSLHMWVLCW